MTKRSYRREVDPQVSSSDTDDKSQKIEQEPVLCQKCNVPFQGNEEGALNGIDDTSILVNWDGPEDPYNPKNMSTVRKWCIVLVTGLMTFCVTFASSVFATTYSATAAEFGVAEDVMILGLSLYVLGFAFGPLVWGPLSEIYGRKAPLFAGMATFAIFQIPVAVAHDLQTLFVCRFFGGVFGSAPVAILGGMYVDFMEPISLGVAAAVFAGAAFLGPAAGPIMGSFITQSSLSWRWTIWITLLMTVAFGLPTAVITPETFEPVLLRRRAKERRYVTRNWALHAKAEEYPLDFRTLLNKYLTKPLHMIALEPILIVVTIYMALVYGILLLTFEAYPISFGVRRGWSPTVGSLPFICIFAGVVGGCLAIAAFTKTWYARRISDTARQPTPEDRLPPMIAGSFVLPIGLFWFAWTSDPSISWVAQVLSGLFIGAGIILIFMTGVVYLIDVYARNANSALAVNTFIRFVVAASFPHFTSSMYMSMGVDWATTLLGIICIVLIPFPLLFWRCGGKIRSWSRFAFNPEG
ncbi:uncharacterized protein Z519_03665 [Cladophialophora bantiana CBS 173.52]|uniref:Major facilitator superfamily (MFS) profile domain-containing protein n=1 Tax=Cladophialophora bantiana (strain ATCC 10958 / CBS 173.52 / CDC B-1940 / NIH 8579) TaxID=1442370 RepID=A0A0D2G922_CLAB1|nr:uncharacterized protein Z519_03665 [Cladophialophora bantiana CBS 173.52]KIW95082.1 hypothetical protein Z519_03665 [Cladophialophora bantiana CBS 173.52]